LLARLMSINMVAPLRPIISNSKILLSNSILAAQYLHLNGFLVKSDRIFML
jgi:hypothetical protein